MIDLAEFHRQIGHKVVYSGNVLWIDSTALSMMTCPGALAINPSLDELREVLEVTNKVIAVFCCSKETGREMNIFVVRDKAYGLHCLQRQFRQQVIRGLKRCQFRHIAWGELHRLAMPLNCQTMLRRGVRNSPFIDAQRWRQLCRQAPNVAGLETFACFVGDELAAYIICYIRDGMSFGLHMLWAESFQQEHPTHVLYYEFVREMMQRKEVQAITLGRQSVPPMHSVDRFKTHAGFQPEKMRIGIAVHPKLAASLTNQGSLGLMRMARQHFGHIAKQLNNTLVFEVAAETHLK